MFAIKFYKEVSTDISNARIWYKEINAELEQRFIEELRLSIQKLYTHPKAFAIRKDNLRRLNLKIFPYCIYYFVDDSIVTIVAVLHTKSNHTNILKRK